MTAAEFKQRFLPLHRQLFALAYRLMGTAEDAEDMLQEAYLKLWSQRERIDADNAEAYCRTVVQRLCIDHLRSRHDTLSTDDDSHHLPLPAAESTTAHVERRDEAALALRLMEQLPDRQRMVMTLHDVEGMPYEEVTQATGLTEQNVRVLLCRARKKIREQLLKWQR